MKLNDERRWFLRDFEARTRGAWSINLRAAKKWEGHLRALIKGGLMEEAGGIYRVTDAGREAIANAATEIGA